jgi:phytoene/squalene synthetase
MKQKFDQLSAKCSKATTKHYSTSFSLGIRFLGRDLREPIYAIYGFVRLADEIVDSFHDHDKAALLAEFKADCFKAIELGISLNPVLNAFQHAVKRYNIGHDLIHLFFNSMEMDLQMQNYTREKYDEYVLGSAQVVGLMCLRVFTHSDAQLYEQLKQPAMKLGSAFQKVNFLRDINADYHELNRSYFPGVDMNTFTNADKRLIEQEIRLEFSEALIGIKQLPVTARRGVYLAYVYYKKLFQKLTCLQPDKVMTERVRISNGYKLWLMCGSFVRFQMGLL